MAGAKIGALRVDLGIDSASFEAGLKKAQSGLGKWQAVALGAFAAVAVAGTAAGVALGRAMGDAINRFDEMGKAAQKVGLSVEALSRLNYAAQLSDVSLEQLTGGLSKLSANMAKVAAGAGGPAATALSALGISATEAGGQLRSADAVFGDIAVAFSRMENGSTKTALAIQIFGKAGAELIPLLNEGKDGLAELAAEADKLGVTIGGSAARNAEIFNDNMTRLQLGMQGVVNAITEAALPVLSYLSEAFIEAASDGETLEAFAKGFVEVIKFVVSTVAIGVTALKAFGEAISTVMVAGSIAQSGFQNWGFAIDVLKNGFADIGNDIGATIEFVNGLWAAIDTGEGGGGGSRLRILIDDLAAAKEAAKQFKEELAAGQSVFLATRTPFEALQLELDKLGHLLNAKAIDWETYQRAMQAATIDTAASALGSISNLVGGLSSAFGDLKALSIATAVLKGAESIASAFAEGTKYFGPVGGAIYAGIAAAAAIANVARVAAVGPTSTSISGGGAASTPSVPAPSTQPQLQQTQAVNVTLRGGGRYSRNEVEDMLRAINEGLGDGMKLNIKGV